MKVYFIPLLTSYGSVCIKATVYIVLPLHTGTWRKDYFKRFTNKRLTVA